MLNTKKRRVRLSSKNTVDVVLAIAVGFALTLWSPVVAQVNSTPVFVCPPCESGCHDTVFSERGLCPVCSMKLVPHSSRRSVAIVLWEGVELLNFAGPGSVFSATRVADNNVFNVYTVAVSTKPIKSAGFLDVVPQYDISNCPIPDILVIPGGHTNIPLADRRLIKWVADTSSHAEIVLSVCTGALVLARANLIDFREATTCHSAIEDLRTAAPKATLLLHRRFVDNGHVVTSAGVSTGVDASLAIVARLYGRDIARKTAEYVESDSWKSASQTAVKQKPAGQARVAILPPAATTNSGAEPKVRIEETDVWIESGSIRLRGTFHRLYRPDGTPTPAAVLVHGSAPTPRSNLSYYTKACLRAGISVLAFDKRGCGESSGRYRPFTVAESESIFTELAQDASNAHKWLMTQEGIDRDRIGFVGGSQAGWIMPLAAMRTPDAAFIVSGAGSPLSAGEEAYHGEMSGDGSGTGRLTVPEADLALQSYDGPRGFDPGSILEEMNTPMLWIFMTEDSVIPTNGSIDRIRGLIASGKRNHAMHILEDADHNYRNVKTGERYDIAPIMTAWLQE